LREDKSATVDLRGEEDRKRDACATLFNESQSRIVISLRPENLDNAIAILREREVPFQQLGKVGGGELKIKIDEQTFRWRIAEIYDQWWTAIRRAVEQDESIPSL
jgi:phosphoribosylformylglycinamidine (FGAM) synthase-like enzyme